MNKVPGSEQEPEDAKDMLQEYNFDYRKARPNRFAPGIADGSLVVVLEPDIAQVFKTPEAVKNVLRAFVAVLPPSQRTGQ